MTNKQQIKYPAHAALERGDKNHYLAIREEFAALQSQLAASEAMCQKMAEALRAVNGRCTPEMQLVVDKTLAAYEQTNNAKQE